VLGAVWLGLCASGPAEAQERFTSLFVFGDSLSDPGNRFALSGGTIPASPPYFMGRRSNGLVAPELLSGLLGFSVNNLTNFAIDGAVTSGNPTSVLGADQLGKFNTNFGVVPSGALVEIYAGANDYMGILGVLGNSSAITALVNGTVADIGTTITDLAHAGGKVFLVPGLDLGFQPMFAGPTSPAVAAVAAQHNQTLVATLGALRASLGVQVVYVDTQALYNDIRAHPSAYGFTNLTTPCLVSGTTTPSGACGSTLVNGTLPSTGVLYYDGVHPTEQTQLVIAEFDAASIAAEIEAPRAAAATPELAFAGVTAQQYAILNRLTALRLAATSETYGVAAQGFTSGQTRRLASGSALADASDARPQLAESVALAADLSLSFTGAYAFGRNAGTPTQVGFGYDTYLASIAVDKRASPNTIVGAAATFADSEATLDLGDGRAKMRSYMVSLYGAWFRGGAFADGLVGASYDDYYDLARATSFPIYPAAMASPGGYSAFAAADAGYLFDVGNARLGPLVSIRYTHSAVDAYQENNAAMLDLAVGSQSADSAVGGFGVEATTHLTAAGYDIAPTASLTAEHEFANGKRSVTTSLAGGLADTITTQGAQRTVGRIDTGVTVQLSPRALLALQFASSFGAAGTDHLVAARLHVAW
jgi:outer membrane lipase/esterase